MTEGGSPGYTEPRGIFCRLSGLLERALAADLPSLASLGPLARLAAEALVVGQTETTDERESSMRRDAVFFTFVACFGVTAWDGAGVNIGAGRVLGSEPPSDKRD